MYFFNPWLLCSLFAVALPVILHLFNRRKSKKMKWGAMLFLKSSLAKLQKRIVLEDILLLVCRILAVALPVIAFARPFASNGFPFRHVLAFLFLLVSVAAFSFAAVQWHKGKWRAKALAAGAVFSLLALSVSLSGAFSGKGADRERKDIAIILDASSSMLFEKDGQSSFAAAKKIAGETIEKAPRKTAFALILGSAAPVALSPAPISDRKLLFRLLDEAKPLEGTFNAPDAISLSSSILLDGENPSKQIIVIGDGQAAGWNLESEAAWTHAGENLRRLPGKQNIVWRRVPLTDEIRNLAVTAVRARRGTIGTDRPVEIDVEIANCGSEAATPSELLLSVEGSLYREKNIPQLLPGQKRMHTFRHKFRSPGTHPARAILEAADDMPADNTLSKVLCVRPGLNVLVLESSGKKKTHERPGTFISLSLAPSGSTLSGKTDAGKDEGKFFVRPRLAEAESLDETVDLTPYSVVILAGTGAIADPLAKRLVSFAEAGGGIMAVPGTDEGADFLNGWMRTGGVPFMPLELGAAESAGAHPKCIDPMSIRHPALLALKENGDLSSAAFETARSAKARKIPGVATGASFEDGTPFFAYAKTGKGCVLQFSASLSPLSGNIISRQSFLPMIHELVYSLARPVVSDLNLEPPATDGILLAENTSAALKASPEGLRAIYRLGGENGRLLKASIDKKLDFNWRTSSIDPSFAPDEEMHITWTGSLSVPFSGKYRIYSNAPGRTEIIFPGDKKNFGLRRSSVSVDLSKGKPHDIIIKYSGPNRNNSYFSLRWSAPGLPDSVVPRECLRAFRTMEDAAPEEFPSHIAAGGAKYGATLRIAGGTLSLHSKERLAPGVYHAMIPALFMPELADIATLSNGCAKVSFSVSAKPEESTIAKAQAADLALAQRHCPISVVDTADGESKAMDGATVGMELWRLAAIPALVLLIAEIFLARAISKSRRHGETSPVEFDTGAESNRRFEEILKSIRDFRK